MSAHNPRCVSSIKICKKPAFQHLLLALRIYWVAVRIKKDAGVSQQNSPWGLSPAAACGVGSAFFWPLRDHCDKSDTGLPQRGAVESQTDRRIVNFWIGTRAGACKQDRCEDAVQASC